MFSEVQTRHYRLRIMELSHLTTEFKEVSVIFRDVWQLYFQLM